MSNIVFNFVKIYNMITLKDIQDVVVRLPFDIILNGIIFIEVDKLNYQKLKDELVIANIVFSYDNKKDFGVAMKFNFNGCDILITAASDKISDEYYVAFKTKVG